ncbi:hypothetical protein ENBRE01_1390 [Enteropsectra breve]|nr:hypothetical protein ENBRE01_1390 [Enteropsectra breve]
MNKRTPLIIFFGVTLTAVVLCVLIFKPKQLKSIFESSKSDSTKAECLYFTNTEESIAMCEFLTSNSEFKKAIKGASLKNKSEIMKGIQMFVQNEANLSEKQNEDIIRLLKFDYMKFRGISNILVDMKTEERKLFDPHFTFEVKYAYDKVKDYNNTGTRIMDDHIFNSFDMQKFKEKAENEKYPKIIEHYCKYNGIRDYESKNVQSVIYPSCLIFRVNKFAAYADGKETPETVFSIPKSTDSDKQIVYRIKAILVKVNGVVKVKKSKDEQKISKLLPEEVKYIMDEAHYILYERD